MPHSPSLIELLAAQKASVNVVWFAMLGSLLVLGGIAFALPHYGIQPISIYRFSQTREYVELGAYAILIVAIYVRLKMCSIDYLLRRLKKMPLTSSSMSHKLNHYDYRLKLAPQYARRFNNLSMGEQRVFYVYSLYYKSLTYTLALVQLFALVGFSVSTLVADFEVVLPYLSIAGIFNILFLLPTPGTPEAAIVKARARSLITTT